MAPRLARIDVGRGGRPLLLVHGFTGAKEDFADHVDALAAAGHHVVAPDLPGHGGSHPADAAFGLEAFAEEVLDLLDELGWARCSLLGHSMGGIVAQLVALRAPDRLRDLVLMSTTPAAVDVDAGLVELACTVAATEGMAALLDAQRALGGPLDTEIGRRLRAERPGWDELQAEKFLRCSAEMYVALARELIAAPDRADRLAGLDVPTLVLVGAHDQLLRTPSARLAAAGAGARLAVVPDAGHSPQHEAPSAWFAAVTEFWRERD